MLAKGRGSVPEPRSKVRIRQLIVAIGAGVLVYTALAALGGFSGWSGSSASAAYEYQYPGELIVIKRVINDDGGTATAGQWSIHVKSGASEVTGSPQPGSEAGTTYVLEAGTYAVSESGGPAGYILSFKRDCNSDGVVSVPQGGTATCTLVNNDIGPRRTIGFWKNHLTSVLLPVDLGNYTVASTTQASEVFSATTCGSSKPGSTVGCLAGQLLAAKFNIANGNSTCIQPTVDKADAFLSGGTVTAGGVTATGIIYTGPTGTYSLDSAQRTLALTLADALDKYNNAKKTCFNP